MRCSGLEAQAAQICAYFSKCTHSSTGLQHLISYLVSFDQQLQRCIKLYKTSINQCDECLLLQNYKYKLKFKSEVCCPRLLYFCSLDTRPCLFWVSRTGVRCTETKPTSADQWFQMAVRAKAAKRQQRRHSPFSLCFTSPCSSAADIMQLAVLLIKAVFLFPCLTRRAAI